MRVEKVPSNPAFPNYSNSPYKNVNRIHLNIRLFNKFLFLLRYYHRQHTAITALERPIWLKALIKVSLHSDHNYKQQTGNNKAKRRKQDTYQHNIPTKTFMSKSSKRLMNLGWEDEFKGTRMPSTHPIATHKHPIYTNTVRWKQDHQTKYQQNTEDKIRT